MLLEQVSPTLLSMPLIICHRILEKLEPDDRWIFFCTGFYKRVPLAVLSEMSTVRKPEIEEICGSSFFLVFSNHQAYITLHISRLIIRKVCRILKTSVDNFGLHYNSIFVKICESTVSMYLLDDICVYYYDLDDVNLSVTYKGKETIIQGENFLKIAFEDLKIVTNETSSLVLHSYDRSGIFAFFISEQGCINVKSIKLNDFSFKEVLIILPMLNAQKLENIEIEYLYDIDNFKQITCLDQWRNAKIIHFYQNSPGIPIEDLFHIEEFTIYLQNLSVQNAIKIQDVG